MPPPIRVALAIGLWRRLVPGSFVGLGSSARPSLGWPEGALQSVIRAAKGLEPLCRPRIRDFTFQSHLSLLCVAPSAGAPRGSVPGSRVGRHTRLDSETGTGAKRNA